MPKDKRDPIRVIIVDDSPAVRDLLVAVLQGADGIQVVGAGANGEDAIRLVHRLKPDVVTMDVRMPKMDGLEATRRIMREMPTPIIIVAGSFMHSDLGLTFEALKAGALTVVGKPGLNDPETCDKVIQAIRLMAGVPVIHHWGRAEGRGRKTEDRRHVTQAESRTSLKIEDKGSQSETLAPALRSGPCGSAGVEHRKSKIAIIGIAASTGGPAALATVLGALPANFPQPILIVQHVTRGFTVGLAEWLNTQTRLQVSLASHGATPQPGTVLLAPDDYHMQVNLRRVVELVKQPPYKGLRPSANYLFDSLARAFGPRAMGIVLTGMGDDGANGLEALHLTGGLTLAQDEQSCVVYGMPREAAVRNAVDLVLSLDQIALTLGQLA